MRWSFRIARVAGTEVRIHFTFLLLLAWIGLIQASASGIAAGSIGVLFLLLVFFCVLLHEFGHVAAALRFGIRTPRITLFPFGGVASLNQIPKKPAHELIVALAGPLVNVIIAGTLILFRGGLPEFGGEVRTFPPGGIIDGLILVNLVLVVFNLIPAFPMDGGRAFRAFLGFFISRERATAVAASLGQGFAVVGGIFALMSGQPILLLIAIFVFFAAGSEASMVETEHALEGIDAHSASVVEFHVLTPQDSIQHAIDLMLQGSQADFPVVDEEGRCIGIATRNQLIQVLRDRGPEERVAGAVQSLPEQVDAGTPAMEAWQKLNQMQLPALPVVDAEGRLVRWFTRENLSELIMIRSAVPSTVKRQAN